MPEGELEEEVNKIAERITLVPSELLALNKAAIKQLYLSARAFHRILKLA